MHESRGKIQAPMLSFSINSTEILLDNFLYMHMCNLPMCILFFTKSQLAQTQAATATAVTPSPIQEHNVAPMQQSSVQHLANQMSQLQMSGSQYITSPVHSPLQGSWQMMHQHGQPHPHYMSLEVMNKIWAQSFKARLS